MNFADDQAIAFQAAESLGKHFLRDAADGPAQFRIALRPTRQDLNDERRPFVRDAIEDDTRGTLRLQDGRGCSFHSAFLGANAPDASGE